MTQQKWTHPLMDGLPETGHAIEAKSYQIIEDLIAEKHLASHILPIATRIVHAVADPEIAETLRVHPEALDRGIAAIRDKKPIFCDVRMLQMGITKTACEVYCAISDPNVINLAKELGTTRAAAAIDQFAETINGSIVAVGNAPTALWKILELAETRGIRPALVVGLPVGFVGAAESKQALLESDLCHITNVGPRGGSPMAAAAVNAIAKYMKEEKTID